MAKSPPYFVQLLNALDGADLSANARAVLMAQFKFATHATGRDSRPSEARLMEYLGPDMSQSRLRRARRELRDKGWLIERTRGHNGKTMDSASTYEVVIPRASVPAPPRPKRTTNNPSGRNGKQKFEVTGDLKLEVNSSSFPSKFEVTGDHLPREPLRGSKDRSYGGVTQEPRVQFSGPPGGGRVEVDSGGVVPPGRHVVGPIYCRCCHEVITDTDFFRQGDGSCTPYRYTHLTCELDPEGGNTTVIQTPGEPVRDAESRIIAVAATVTMNSFVDDVERSLTLAGRPEVEG